MPRGRDSRSDSRRRYRSSAQVPPPPHAPRAGWRSPPRRSRSSRRRSPPPRSPPRQRPRSSRPRSPPYPRRSDSRGRLPSTRQRSPPPRDSSRSRSRGERSLTLGQHAAPSAVPTQVGDESRDPAEYEAEVVKGVPLNNGDCTWQATILVPHGGTNHVGKQRTMCIRGPSRTLEEQAQRDAEKLTFAARDGSKAVRAAADQIQRDKKRMS
eukprot:TRINITY_DN34776_c0_g1_i1.p1 TRINITY_DN34776_c0_g1~~TRINITY_DN34776_c0_g1_i1.p1  ORF type:complete len:226 (-),score=27.58 TRINITY_DN34776_c0_g1_i1:120-749(-)